MWLTQQKCIPHGWRPRSHSRCHPAGFGSRPPSSCPQAGINLLCSHTPRRELASTLASSWGQKRPGLPLSGPQQLYTWMRPFPADGRPPVLSFLQHRSSEAPTSTFPTSFLLLSEPRWRCNTHHHPSAAHRIPAGGPALALGSSAPLLQAGCVCV